MTEIDWDAAVDFSNFSGTLSIWGQSEFAAVAIRVSPGAFATWPVAPGP